MAGVRAINMIIRILTMIALLFGVSACESINKKCVSDICLEYPRSWDLSRIVENKDHMFFLIGTENLKPTDSATVGFQLYKFPIDADLNSIARRLSSGMDESIELGEVKSKEFSIFDDSQTVKEKIIYELIFGMEVVYLREYRVYRDINSTLIIVTIVSEKEHSNYESTFNAVIESVQYAKSPNN
jgi:hypothetical protein